MRRFDERSNDTKVVLITSARANVNTESLVISICSQEARIKKSWEEMRREEGESKRAKVEDTVVR